MIPLNKKLHFFDLDGVLWSMDSRVWVIDKEEPSNPIMRLDKFETNRILSGFYIKEELEISYNGEKYHISENLFNRIKKKKNIDIERLGLSWIEFYDKKYINNSKTKFLFKNINHLKGEENYICILTARPYRDRHADILNTLRISLLDIGIDIYKVYFISDRFYTKHNEEISLKKSHILLEHLIGVKIEDDKFVSKKQDWYTEVYFYDDEKQNIDYANDMQILFDRIMKKTDDELFLTIIERIKKYDIFLYTNLVTNNDLNRFVTTKIKLLEPVKYPIKLEHIENFKKFLNG